MTDLAESNPESNFHPEITFSPSDPVEALQAAMLQLPQYELETGHLFHGGHYIRALWRPAGCLIVGKRHKVPHLYLIVSGTVRVGEETITGPRLIECEPGTKRAVYAITDALCMTVHKTAATDLEAVEAEIVEPDPTSPYTVGNRLKPKELT